MTQFFDTNILIYAHGDDARKLKALSYLEEGGAISVQVLNEFANVAQRKMGWTWDEIQAAIEDVVTFLDPVAELKIDDHRLALTLCKQHHISFYDALILAVALRLGCRSLISEDMQHGRKFGDLTIVNPFL